MTTTAVKITDAEIKRQAAGEARDLRDIEARGLYLRFAKDRTRASWYLVVKGEWKLIGRYPDLSAKQVAAALPGIRLRLDAGEGTNLSKWLLVGELLDWYADRMARDRTRNPRYCDDHAHLLKSSTWAKPRESSTKRHYNYKWQQARAGWLAKHPLCRCCEQAGKVVAATDVDHISPHKGDMVLFWDLHNVEAFCSAYDNWRLAQESIRLHGIVVTGATGGPMKNPALTAANETMRQMVTFGSMLGLDPASRTRLIGGNKEKETNEFANLLRT